MNGSSPGVILFSRDDDAFLHSLNVKGLGDIRVELWTISLEGVSVFHPATLPTDTMVHEKSKKGMAHRIRYSSHLYRSSGDIMFLPDSVTRKSYSQ
jgi:hypothetical protein